MPFPKMRDANLSLSLVLPSGANTVTSTGLDIGPLTTHGQYAPSINGEFILEVPALTATQLPNAATVVFDIIASASKDLSSPVVLEPGFLTVTGAGGVGAVAVAQRFRPATNTTLQYIGYRATGIAATLAATAASAFSFIG